MVRPTVLIVDDHEGFREAAAPVRGFLAKRDLSGAAIAAVVG